MAKSHNGMLGVGGQRKKISRRELRGGTAGGGSPLDPLAAKRELLRRLAERTTQEDDAPEAETS